MQLPVGRRAEFSIKPSYGCITASIGSDVRTGARGAHAAGACDRRCHPGLDLSQGGGTDADRLRWSLRGDPFRRLPRGRPCRTCGVGARDGHSKNGPVRQRRRRRPVMGPGRRLRRRHGRLARPARSRGELGALRHPVTVFRAARACPVCLRARFRGDEPARRLDALGSGRSGPAAGIAGTADRLSGSASRDRPGLSDHRDRRVRQSSRAPVSLLHRRPT